MNVRYFIKLINGEKISTTKTEFEKWIYCTGDSFVLCMGDSGTFIYVPKEKILLGYKLINRGNDE